MLPTHQQVDTHDGYAIHQRQPGFEYTPVMLAKVASYIVQHEDGGWTLFAFMYSLLSQIDGPAVDEDKLLEGALSTIRAHIDAGALDDRAELTFEHRPGGYVQVTSPRWWIPTGM